MSEYFYDSLYIYTYIYIYIYIYIYESYIYYICKNEIKIMKNHETYNKKINI